MTISQESNEDLLSPFREDEVWAALKGTGPTKAPGLDGFPTLFFQQYWHIVGMCIDEVQSAFVLGRLITDNVLLAYEILHTFRQKRTGKKGYMAVKLDMSKAYDRVEWDFVKKMMIKMGFAHEWVGLIMKCISSVSYAVNINGSRGRIFQPTRGFRQGDPLSLFLFLICSEGLSSLMRSAKQEGLVKGAKASRRGPEIYHLLFADDCQCVNFNKSTIFYSSNTTAEAKELVSLMLGVRSSSSLEKYLGLPNVVVLQALPTYAMSCFLFPKTLCEMIESKFARFWWQKGVGKRGIHWCKLKYLCGSKEEGGLGFKSMAQFNIAMLAKQGWRLLNSTNSLVARVFKVKYFPDCNFRFSSLGRSSSLVWRSIWTTKDALEKGLIWKVGTGENISAFEDAWILNHDNARLTAGVGNSHFVKVAELINSNEREWNRDLIGNTFPKAEAELILRIPLAMELHEDLLVWNGELSDEFSVRSSYKILQNSDPTAYALQNIYRGFYNKLWKIDIPTKIKIFIWKISWNFLATRVNMAIRKLTSSTLCPRCAVGEETMNHLFRDCSVSVAIWKDYFVFRFGPSGGIGTLASTKKQTGRVRRLLVLFIATLRNLKEFGKIYQSISNRTVEWKNPPRQTVKINFDGAFDERSKQSASRVVVRDSNGSVLLTSIELHKGVASAFVAEALVCRRATQIALDMNKEEVIIEGDSCP
ncbi:reverse transcriptase [Gossypium australe]|uniref:Reverse transcriptase n=1 Tax=Gossypium australe TaxID=47621 RepID=A0A5B6UWD0_9ROSI|nr:reverse transcriptase [Gossypium australe]